MKRLLHGTITFLLAIATSSLWSCRQDNSTTAEPALSAEPKVAKDINSLLSTPNLSIEASLEQAISVASVQSKNSLRALAHKAVKSSATLYTKQGKAALYIINYSPEGYTVVSASRKYPPIIAQSAKGSISMTDSLPSVRYLLDDYVRQIEYANTLPDSLTRSARVQWEMLSRENKKRANTLRSWEDGPNHNEMLKVLSQWENQGYRVYSYGEFSGSGLLPDNTMSDIEECIYRYSTPQYSRSSYTFVLLKDKHREEVVSPLLKTTWNQSGGYGLENGEYVAYNQFIPNQHPVGCVALATAQIMYYHKWPTSYWKWETMEENYPTTAVAQFLYDVAVRVNTTFEVNASQAKIKDAINYLECKRYQVKELESTRPSESPTWLVQRELNLKRPVLVRGRQEGKDIGHAFVIDGYRYQVHDYDVVVLAYPDAPTSYLSSESLSSIYSTTLTSGGDTLFHLNLGWGGNSNGEYLFNDFVGYNEGRVYCSIKPLK